MLATDIIVIVPSLFHERAVIHIQIARRHNPTYIIIVGAHSSLGLLTCMFLPKARFEQTIRD